MASAGLVAVLALFGCGGPNGDLEPEDFIRVTVRPTVAGTPVINKPGSLVAYDGTRKFAYEHEGDDQYSDAATQLLDRRGDAVLPSKQNRYFENYMYYQTSVINKGTFTPTYDGTFILQATYRTHNPSRFSEPDGFAKRSTPRTFRLCPSFNQNCGEGGRPGVAGGTSQGSGTAGRTRWCGRDGDQCGSTGGGTPGGGTTSVPSYLQTRRHTASMGPFFASANVGSSVSRGEIEDILEGLNANQLDGIADIIEEAYGESVYDYLEVPDEAIAGAARGSDPDESPFLRFMAPLDAADRSGLGLKRVYLDRLLSVRDRYQATRAAEASVLERGATPAGALSELDGPVAAVSATVWPNPTSSRLNIRVSGVQGAAVQVYDVAGRLVARIPVAAHSDAVQWDLRTASGARVAAGVYQIVLMRDGARHATAVTIL